MSWLDKIVPSTVRSKSRQGPSKVPEGLWKKCSRCEAVLYRPELEKNQDVCPKCDHHMRIGARRRLDIFLDEQGREELLSLHFMVALWGTWWASGLHARQK